MTDDEWQNRLAAVLAARERRRQREAADRAQADRIRRHTQPRKLYNRIRRRRDR